MAAHLYWRLNVQQNNGDASYLNFAELQLRETVGGPSVAVGGTVTQSSQFDASTFAAANLFDGNAATTWATTSGSTTGWVAYRFAAGRQIRELAILPRSGQLARAPRRFTLEWSDDGAAWTPALGADYDFTAWADGVLQVFAGDQAVTLTGNATTVTGDPVDAVAIREWETRAAAATATPDASGDWSADVLPGQYDITYFAAGHAPVCHGPYTIAS